MPDERDLADLYSRLDRLESWMRSQHWDGDPIRDTPPDSGPQDAPHLEDKKPKTQKEKDEAAREEVLNQFRQTPDQRMGDSTARLDKLEQWKSELHGESGIRVTGTVIEFIAKQKQIDDAGSASSLEVQDEGNILTSAATTLDFTGAGVTATESGDVVTIDIPGGSGDDTVAENSGDGAGVLKLTTNVTARSLKSSDESILIEEGTDEIDITLPGSSEATEATYIMVQVQLGGTLEAHEVTLRGTDLGEYTE